MSEEPRPCPTCEGRKVTRSRCFMCRGSGKGRVVGGACVTCGGDGETKKRCDECDGGGVLPVVRPPPLPPHVETVFWALGRNGLFELMGQTPPQLDVDGVWSCPGCDGVGAHDGGECPECVGGLLGRGSGRHGEGTTCFCCSGTGRLVRDCEACDGEGRLP